MSALERLREAAKVLRERAQTEAALREGDPYFTAGGESTVWDRLMGPAVGLALADWLDTAGADLWAHGPLCCADGCMKCDDDPWAPHARRALAVADAILGGRS